MCGVWEDCPLCEKPQALGRGGAAIKHMLECVSTYAVRAREKLFSSSNPIDPAYLFRDGHPKILQSLAEYACHIVACVQGLKPRPGKPNGEEVAANLDQMLQSHYLTQLLSF